MTLFYLIRHGDIEWGPGDPDLSALGRAQAAAVAAFLKPKSITRIYSSPLRRALETAQIIAQATGAPEVIDLRLRERMNWGDVAGQNWPEFEAEWRRASRDRDYIPPGGLSARQAAANLADFLGDAARRHPLESLAAVTHEWILGDYLTEYFPISNLEQLNAAWKTRRDDAITHCSVTTLQWDANGPHLEGVAVVVKP